MAKQTFTTGQVLLASQLTNLQQTAMLGGSASIKTVSYTLVAADAGSTVAMNSASSTTITVNQNLFSAGDIVTIYNKNTGVLTITAGTATVTTSGSLALSQNQGGVLHFTSASAAIFFQFATPVSGGKILQVVQGNTTTSTTSTSNTYIDSTLTASITPAAATSKVLIIVSLMGVFTAANNTGISPKLVRGATDLVDYFAMPQIPENGSNIASDGYNWNFSYLDSPSTTSSTTYKIQIKSFNGATVTVQKNSVNSYIQLLEVGA